MDGHDGPRIEVVEQFSDVNNHRNTEDPYPLQRKNSMASLNEKIVREDSRQNFDKRNISVAEI